ncbi:MAG TPA: hypothetical protein VJ023_16850, partial [Pyrinomonadaceae bacterium]|nr:hypothetical protein [Pyrinomonadaceae bacterium]
GWHVYRLRRDEVIAPFEGAELNLAGTRLVSFRPFERRRRKIVSSAINMFPLRGKPEARGPGPQR